MHFYTILLAMTVSASPVNILPLSSDNDNVIENVMEREEALRQNVMHLEHTPEEHASFQQRFEKRAPFQLGVTVPQRLERRSTAPHSVKPLPPKEASHSANSKEAEGKEHGAPAGFKLGVTAPPRLHRRAPGKKDKKKEHHHH